MTGRVDRRLLLVALVLIPVAAAVQARRAAGATSRHHVDAVKLMREVVASAAAASDSVALREKRLEGAMARGFAGEGTNAAMAAVARYVGRVAKAAEVELGSVRVSVDSQRGMLRRLRVDAAGAGDIRGVAALLRELDSGSRLVRLRSISLGQPGAAQPAGGRELLSVQLSIEALATVRAR